uniref:PB1 domain-containing protein n=1 Tax=Glossina pallidipes TaxID=7398 RepID=A0A1A9ZSU3_GLOPL
MFKSADQQPMSSSVFVLKVTYKLQQGKALHVYLKTVSPTYEYIRTEIERYFFDLHQLQADKLRIYWVDEEWDEIEIFNQHDYEIFMVTSLERRRLFVTPIIQDEQFSEEASEVNANLACPSRDNENDGSSEIDFVNDFHVKPCGLYERNDNYTPWDDEEEANSVQEEAAVNLNSSYATDLACPSSDNEDEDTWDSFVKVESPIPAEERSNGKNVGTVIADGVAFSGSAEITNEQFISGAPAEGVASSGSNSTEAPIEIVYHADEFINSGVKVLMNMGFTNGGNVLAQLLEGVDGIIPAALDALPTVAASTEGNVLPSISQHLQNYYFEMYCHQIPAALAAYIDSALASRMLSSIVPVCPLASMQR